MKVERTTDMQEILKCVPFEYQISEKGRDRSKIKDRLLYLNSQIHNPFVGLWIAYDDNNEVLGYTLATIVLIPGVERLHLLRMYAPTSDIRDAFETILRDWAKEYKVKFAQIAVTKGVRALQRKYGFKPDSINMIRRI